MFPTDWISLAAQRIAPYIRLTPVTFDSARNLHIKWENEQVTGSFKARGALNKALALEEWEQRAGLVAASAGNHGQGVALAGQLLHAPVTVFASEHAVPVKLNAMRAMGAQVNLVAGGYPQAESAGKAYAAEQNQTWISPYNDGQVIAGQGTIGLELAQQIALTRAQTVFIPASGGGLAAGIGASLSQHATRPRLVGVQAQAAPFLHHLFHHGTQDVTETDTLADGLSGAVEEGSITIPLAQTLLDDFVLVSEEEIGRALAFAYQTYGAVIEASAAVALAAALRAGGGIVVITGGNIQPEMHAQLVARYMEAA
jgi:threonine dehydratase